MKRWLAICAVGAAAFAVGIVAGSLLENRGHAKMYQEMCLALFTEHGSNSLFTMVSFATGHAESIYDVAESNALLCVSPVKPEDRSPEMLKCAANLKLFYDQFPERKASLQRHHPAEAQRLGFAATP
jgi:hypothetical protein